MSIIDYDCNSYNGSRIDSDGVNGGWWWVLMNSLTSIFYFNLRVELS